MQTHHAAQQSIEDFYQTLELPAPDQGLSTGEVCGALGLVVLMVMLLIATGTMPLYDWQA